MASGTQMWQRYYGGSEDDEFVRTLLTTDGLITLVGNTKSYGDVNNDFWLLKVNQNGDSIHSKVIGSPNKSEFVYDFIEDHHQMLILCGSYDTSITNKGKNVCFAVKTDLNGNSALEVKYPGAVTDDDKFFSVSNTRTGDLYFFSREYSNTTPYNIDVEAVLTTDNFVYLQAKTQGELKEDIAYETSNTRDNGFLMVGFTARDITKSQDIYVIKLNLALDSASQVTYAKNLPKDVFNLYYYDGIIYFNNSERIPIPFEIYNSMGVLVETNITTEKFIEINQVFSRGIYTIILKKDSPISLKFVKY
jgi:hypothetical protein